MSRIVRHILFASVLACHAAITLLGPCLHALTGSSHDLVATSKSHHSSDCAQSPRDGADNCLICQFVAQGQLRVELASGLSVQLTSELVAPDLSATHTLPLPLPSSPRARRGGNHLVVIGYATLRLAVTCMRWRRGKTSLRLLEHKHALFVRRSQGQDLTGPRASLRRSRLRGSKMSTG